MENKNINSLWPEFHFKEVKTPLSVLREQANQLGQKTSNILVGEILPTEAFDEKTGQLALIYQFYIKAPFLSNYRYLLLRLVQKANLYPVDIYFSAEKKTFNNIQEEEFENTLQSIFNNPQTINTIESLYAQSFQMASAIDNA